MKHHYLLFVILFFSACSKEELYGPNQLKNGQEVELLVDHRYAAEVNQLLISPQNQPAEASLSGFTDRKPGYSYRVKATFHVDKNPAADGPDRWFDFKKVISEEKYLGTEAFDISLIKSYIPGGPFISLQKTGDQYDYIEGKLQLTYNSETIKNQLEEIWQNAEEIRKNYSMQQVLVKPKWKAIKAIVIHDPANFGKAYLVQRIEFTP